jgi:NAD-dependent SIR2 family protein deacetylase
MKKVLILSGAGISSESGIRTFRDADGSQEGSVPAVM